MSTPAEATATDRAFYATNTLPWEGVATKGIQHPANAKTIREALHMSGLDWTVALDAVYAGPDKRLVKDKQSIVRLSDGEILAIVGKKYQPVQNLQVFSFLDSLVQDDVMEIENAGEILGGRRVWVEARMKEGWMIGGDKYANFIVGHNSHDGSTKATFFLTSVHLFCGNQITRALAGADEAVGIYHRGNIDAKLEAASKFMQITTAEQRRMREWLEAMQKAKLDRYKTFQALREQLFGIANGTLDEAIPEQRKSAVDLFRQIYYSEQERRDGEFKDTAYAAVQAVTGYADHAGLTRKRDNGTQGMFNFYYQGRKFKLKGLGVIAKLTKTPMIAS